ncbi:hypothetical protein [Promicromonospora sukumoe]|uniref:hypothetical protein n=1 Tax=Promicromonospora sukumoe TaxID=88382 RepID=UPI00364FD388
MARLAADQYVLGADDVLAIVNALGEVLDGPDAMDDPEFRLRIGVSRTAARQAVQGIRGARS